MCTFFIHRLFNYAVSILGFTVSKYYRERWVDWEEGKFWNEEIMAQFMELSWETHTDIIKTAKTVGNSTGIGI
jgi:hypothetical protein